VNRRIAAAGAVAAAIALAFVLFRNTRDPGGAPSRALPSRPPASAVDAGPATPPPIPPPGPGTEATPRGGTASPAPVDPAPVLLKVGGRVVDERGTGVAGAEVEVRGRSPDHTSSATVLVRTGADGTFEAEIRRDFAGEGLCLATTADGFVEGFLFLKPEECGDARGVEIRVEAARAIVGRVVDEYGRPIPGCTVQLWYGSETTWPTDAGADGRFRTPRHAPAKAFELIVEVPGLPRRTIPLEASTADPTDVGDLVFRREGDLAGVAVDGAGVPVPDLPVAVLGVAGPPDRAPRARTDGAGAFRFTGLGEGTVQVCVDGAAGEGGAPGARRRYRGNSGDVAVGSAEVRLVVRTETAVVLRFVDAATGEPVDVRAADYGFREEGAPEPERLPHGASSSDPLLSTRLSLWPGRYDLTVRSPGFEVFRRSGVEVQDLPEVTIDVPMRRSP